MGADKSGLRLFVGFSRDPLLWLPLMAQHVGWTRTGIERDHIDLVEYIILRNSKEDSIVVPLFRDVSGCAVAGAAKKDEIFVFRLGFIIFYTGLLLLLLEVGCL